MRIAPRIQKIFPLGSLALLAAGVVCQRAEANTFNVPDGDVNALIIAINTANTIQNADVINLAADGQYVLTTAALPFISSPITINGNGATVEGGDPA